MKKKPSSHGFAVKKQFGQHFLRDDLVAEKIVDYCDLDGASVIEIGCGDGALTRMIIQSKLARFWVFEIDPEWASFVRKKINDQRMQIFVEDILTVDFARFEPYKPWVLLANLPYQITFPLLHQLQEWRYLLREGVIMIQEEVAHKLVATHGRGYGFQSLFFQHYFELKLLDKIPPAAFYPPPKIFSRLVYFKPRQNIEPIANENEFWAFIKACFKQPRRTLKNNLFQKHYDVHKVPEETLALRAQQMNFAQLQTLWGLVQPLLRPQG